MLNRQRQSHPEPVSVIPHAEQDRNSRRTRIAIAVLIVLSAGLIGVSGVSQPIHSPPEVLAEAVFNQVIPYNDQEDLFFFWGEADGQQGHYVLDFRTGEFRQDDEPSFSLSDERIQPLENGHHVRIENNGSKRRLVVESSGGARTVLGTVPASGSFQVSPKKDAFVYMAEVREGWGLFLFRLDPFQPMPLLQEVSPALSDRSEPAQWSPSGKYLLIDDQWIVSAEDGRLLHRLSATVAIWSPMEDVILFVPSGEGTSDRVGNEDVPLPYGNRLALWDIKTKAQSILYEAGDQEAILGKPVWDGTGRYFAFATGVQEDGEWFYSQVHVMDKKRFHYVESEQNVSPTRLTHLTVSPGGQYLSYSVNGVLKLIHLGTQESRIYEQKVDDEQTQWSSVRFDPKGVWLAREHEVVFITENMEEKRVYHSRRPLLGFMLSSSGNRLLVMEEMANGQRLRLINLQPHFETP
jgi:hypothetical protein